VVSPGPGSYNFTANVIGRDQVTWVNTITRMLGYGAVVADVNGTAAYLAGLGSGTPTPTPTGTLVPTPTATRTPRISRIQRGAAEYQQYCASCHDPAAPGFVGESIFGTSLGEIRGALAEVGQMQFLQALLTPRTVGDIARYLRANRRLGGGGGDGGGN
jgi:mono/diheme cytochrome c family protein